MIYRIYKKVGETPLQALERLRKERGLSKNKKLTYACRLDPMAEGVMLVLSGKELKKKEEFLQSDKIYEVEVLLGLSTDSGDILGLPQNCNQALDVSKKKLQEILKKFEGKIKWRYPIFSGKTINGEKIFSLYLKGKLKKEQIPFYESKIKSIELIDLHKISSKEFLKEVIEKLNKLQISSINEKFSDFRKEEVKSAWQKLLATEDKSFLILKIRVHSAKGVFMRQLAQKIGKSLGSCAIAKSIKRVEILL